MIASPCSIAKLNTDVPGLLVICGPTATGKSGLAIALAQRLNSAILSADSRQVYREFNIGTAKPSPDEQRAVPHFLIDLCDPTEILTVAAYQELGQALINAFHTANEGNATNEQNPMKVNYSSVKVPFGSSPQGREQPLTVSIPSSSAMPLLVGGTGLYIRAIANGLKIPRVPPQPHLRSQLQSLGQSQCYTFLQQVDPPAAAKIHPNDHLRTVRSLEVFYTTGLPISAQQGENPPSYPILHIGLDCQDSETLRSRIARRTVQMIAAGFTDEVAALCQKYGTDLPLLNTLGYAEFKQHLSGDLSLNAAQDLTILRTRQFAKRQHTWFRACPDIEWFDADAPDLLEQVWMRVQQFLPQSRFG